MKSWNSSSRSLSSNLTLYSSRLSEKNPLTRSWRKMVLPQMLVILEALVTMRLRNSPSWLQMIMMWSQVMYITEAVYDSISHPCARAISDQHRQEMFLRNNAIDFDAFIFSTSPSLGIQRNFTINCQLFFDSNSGRSTLSLASCSFLSKVLLKQLTLSISTFSSQSETCSQISASDLVSMPRKFFRQFKKLVITSLIFLAASFSSLSSAWMKSVIRLPLSANSCSSPITLLSIFLSSPMKKPDSFMGSLLLSLMSLPSILDSSFSASSSLPNSCSNYFSPFFISFLYFPYSFPSESSICSRVLQIFFICPCFSFWCLFKEKKILSMLLLQGGSQTFVLAPFSSTASSNFGWKVSRVLSVFFSLFSKTKA